MNISNTQTGQTGYPKGFVVVDKGAIDSETRAKIEDQGYIVIEKSAGGTVGFIYAPIRQ